MTPAQGNPQRRARPSAALVVAVAALFVALGGSALALSKASVKSKHIRDGAVKSVDLRDGDVTSADLRDGDVRSGDVADDALTGADVDESTLALGPAGGPPTGPAGGALAGSYPDPSLAPDAVGSSEVAADSLVAEDLAPRSVDSDELASGSVNSSELSSASVFASEVADGSLNGDDVGRESGTVTIDPPVLELGGLFACRLMIASTGVSDDLRDDLIVVSGEHTLAAMTITPMRPSAAGQIAVNVCNTSGLLQDPAPFELHWIAFDV